MGKLMPRWNWRYPFIALFCSLYFISMVLGSCTPASSVETPETITMSMPPPDINPKDVLNLLWNQTSFRWTIDLGIGNPDMRYLNVIRVKEPESYYFRMMEEKGVVTHFITIGQREWVGRGTQPDNWIYINSVTGDEKDIVKSLRELMLSILASMFPERSAKVVNTSVKIDNVPCSEYVCDTAGEEIHIFIANETGFPVKADWGSVKINDISHINDPDNVIKSPISEFPKKLHLDDARMSLNGLSSFQWTYWPKSRLEGSTEISDLFFEGTWMQINQACHVSVSNIKGEQPVVDFLQVGQEQWERMLVVEGLGWAANKWTEKYYLGEPFHIWGAYKELADKEGNLVAEKTTVVNGINCNEYLFQGTKMNKLGEQMILELRVYASADAGLPMRLGGLTTGPRGFFFSDVWELSHINDPANIIEPPEN